MVATVDTVCDRHSYLKLSYYLFVGIIRGYRVQVINRVTGMMNTFNSDLPSATLTDLDCCTDYSYTVTATTIDFGTVSQVRNFRTQPDLSGKISLLEK